MPYDSIGFSSRQKINLTRRHEIAYWTKRMGCTEEQLRTAVTHVGLEAVDVCRFLSEAAATALDLTRFRSRSSTKEVPVAKVACRSCGAANTVSLMADDVFAWGRGSALTEAVRLTAHVKPREVSCGCCKAEFVLGGELAVAGG